MKKLTFIFILCSFALYANATVFIDETFNYSVSNLSAASGWTTAGTLTTGTGRNILSSALTYSNSGKTYILSGVGKTLSSDISSSSDFKSFKPFSSTAIESGAVYMSFLYNAGVAQGQTNSELMGLADGTSQGPRIWVGKGVNNASNFRFGLTRGSTTASAIIWDSKEFSDPSETILLVIKYDFDNSTASVFINPIIGSSSETTADIIDNTTTTIRTKLDNLWFRSQGNSKSIFNVGGIRVASTWAEIMADRNTPKLNVPVVGIASNISGEGFTADWSTVANAKGYSVNIYQGTTLIGTNNITGGTETSLLINGLFPNTAYTYKVIANGDGLNFSNSEESIASVEFTTLNSGVASILTDFGDGTWGEVATSAYPAGSYPTYSANGFNFIKTFLYTGSVTCATGEKHTNRILFGKSSEGASLEFPLLTSLGEVEIHAATGTDGMSFRLEEFNGTQWDIIGTYTTRKSPDSIYTIPVLRNSVTKLRIANNTSSGLYLYKILTRTFQEATELTLRTTSPTESEICFANLKKQITLTFNKNIEKVSGTILLNGIEIPISICSISDNVVSIPVSLENLQGSNKNYILTVSAGTFAQLGNNTNLSKAINLNFQTIKAVVYPSDYTAQLDVNYKNVNSTNTRMDIYYSTNKTTPTPVVINMHGGGWSGGYKEEQGGFNMYFERGYAVANVEYRLRGEALAPACVEDVRGALHYILNHASELNIDVNKVIFQGGSAGGHLALMGGYLMDNRMYDNDCVQYPNPIKIMAVIDKYGPCDFTQLMFYSSLIAWAGPRFSDVNFVNSLAPISYVNANTPPTYIIHGDADPTIPYIQSVTLNTALEAAGVKHKFTTVPDGGHGGFSAAYNTQMETEIGDFLNEVLNNLETNTKHPETFKFQVIINSKQVKINTSEELKITVYDSLGKEIMHTNQNEFSLDKKGVYILKISSNLGKYVTKVII